MHERRKGLTTAVDVREEPIRVASQEPPDATLGAEPHGGGLVTKRQFPHLPETVYDDNERRLPGA